MHVKQWRWIGLGAFGAFLVACAVFVLANPTETSNERCGLGVPPGAPGFAEDQARMAAEVAKDGFLRVCEADLKRYDMSFSAIDRVVKSLAFRPVDLSHTPFAGFKSLGGTAEAINKTKSIVYRGFRMAAGHQLTLLEHDMSADGTNIGWVDPISLTEKINDRPARLAILQAGSGKAVSVLAWIEGRRYYELWINANVASSPLRQQLLALGASLPASVPACPNERPPKPLQFGPDGMPILEPLPDVMTVEEFEKETENAAKRCK